MVRFYSPLRALNTKQMSRFSENNPRTETKKKQKDKSFLIKECKRQTRTTGGQYTQTPEATRYAH